MIILNYNNSKRKDITEIKNKIKNLED